MNYELTRSVRKTLSIRIKHDGTLDVRAPLFVSRSRIEAFIASKRNWIEKHRQTIIQSAQKEYTAHEIRAMKKRLAEYIIPRVAELWEGTGLPKYTSIKITKSERRWGSCSGKNGLCFSYRLAEYIEENPPFIDAIIVHELAHLREKNHQKPFWNLVYSMMNEYESIIKSHRNVD